MQCLDALIAKITLYVCFTKSLMPIVVISQGFSEEYNNQHNDKFGNK